MVSHVTEVAKGVHRLTNGVANFYLIEQAGKLVLVDAGAPKDWALFTRAALNLGKVSGFGDGEVLDVPGSPRVVHAPGYTGGSAAILLEDRGILFTGDVLCTHNAYTGRVGPQIMPSGLNADTPQALASLANLTGIKADVLLPGHGEPWTEGVEEAVRQAQTAGPS